MLSRGLFVAVAALLCLGLGAAFQLRPSQVRFSAVVRNAEIGSYVADSAALLQSSPVHLEAEGVGADLAARAEKRKASWGDLPTGVSLHKTSGKYVVTIRTGGSGKSKYLGSFATPEEAEEAVRSAKSAPEGVVEYIAAWDKKRKAARGDLPKGVYLHKPSGKYVASISLGGKTNHVGYFATPEEAEEAVRSAKSAPEGLEAYLAARAAASEKRKASRGLPKGVYLHKPSGKYVAQIRLGGKTNHVGYFATPEEAEEAVRSAKSAPEGLEAYLAARAAAPEKRKASRGLPKGVYLHKPSGKYRAQISPGGGKKQVYFGYFATPEEAEEDYIAAKSAPEGLEAYLAARAEKRKEKKRLEKKEEKDSLAAENKERLRGLPQGVSSRTSSMAMEDRLGARHSNDIHTHTLERDGTDVQAYVGPTRPAEEMIAGCDIEALGLEILLGESKVCSGLGLFVRLNDETDSSLQPRGTPICGYSKGNFTEEADGTFTVAFCFTSPYQGVMFEKRLMPLIEAVGIISERTGAQEMVHLLDGHVVLWDQVEKTVLVEPTPEYTRRYFLPDPIDADEQGQPVWGPSNLGMYANDVGYNESVKDTEAYERLAENNVLQIVWRLEENDGRLFPSWPIVITQRDVLFANKEPMEVGLKYSWRYWLAAMLLAESK